MDIVFSSVNSRNIKIHPAITINDYNSYQIVTEECQVNHILTLKKTTFIAFNYNGKIHIFNLKNDGVFPEDFQKYIETIKPQLFDYFNSDLFEFDSVFSEGHRKQDAINDDPKNKYGFVVTTLLKECRRTKALNLSNAKSIIDELNIVLKQTCPDFYLRIDYITTFPPNSNINLYDGMSQHLNSFYNFPHIVLCLFTGNDCISSITMRSMNSLGQLQLSIDSKTSVLYEGRKFNKLLRAVAIIISKAVNPDVETLTSTAVNPLSASIMINSFNAESDYIIDEGTTINNSQHTPDDIDRLIKKYFTYNTALKSYVELNDVNIENAKRVFMDIIQPKIKGKGIKCDKLQDETATFIQKEAALPPTQRETAIPTQNKTDLKTRTESQPHSRSKYYRTLGINFGRGGKQIKKRSGRKRSGRKRSDRKRTYKIK